MATTPTVDARWAHLAVERIEAAGGQGGPLLRAAGLRPRDVADPDQRIAFAKHAELLDLAAKALSEPDFGLYLGAQIDPRKAGLLGYTALSARTVGEGLAYLTRHFRVLSEGAQLSVATAGDQAVVEGRVVDPAASGSRQAVEFGMSLLFSICRGLAGRRIRLVRVDFRHPCPAKRRSGYRQVFRAPIRFEQAQNALVIPVDELARLVRTADRDLLHLLRRHCEDILGRQPATTDVVQRVRRMVTERMAGGVPKLSEVAAELGMNLRTLERRLDEAGWAYRGLVANLRHQLALRYLQDPTLKLPQVSFLLGFSEPAAFAHAFRRWTGTTPMRHRQSALDPSAGPKAAAVMTTA